MQNIPLKNLLTLNYWMSCSISVIFEILIYLFHISIYKTNKIIVYVTFKNVLLSLFFLRQKIKFITTTTVDCIMTISPHLPDYFSIMPMKFGHYRTKTVSFTHYPYNYRINILTDKPHRQTCVSFTCLLINQCVNKWNQT